MWKILPYFGKRLRRWTWDNRYRLGSGVTFRNERPAGSTYRATTTALVERLANHGRIVELGCGYGNLAMSLDPNTYSSYTGIDISTIAIGEAKKRINTRGLARCEFLVQDMQDWAGEKEVDLIVSISALEYLPLGGQAKMLNRCMASLKHDGCILIVIPHFHKRVKTIKACHRVRGTMEERVKHNNLYIIIKRGASS